MKPALDWEAAAPARKRRSGRGRTLFCWCAAFLCVASGPLSAAPAQGGFDPAESSNQAVSYSAYSDAELTELGSHWESLSSGERRALLAEVKLRMARDRGRSGVLKIRTTRQYGVVRKPDGTTVRVQRRLVQVVPVRPGNKSARVAFGMGFERRHRPTDARPTDAPPYDAKEPSSESGTDIQERRVTRVSGAPAAKQPTED